MANQSLVRSVMNAIREQESGGNYDASNQSGATGAYQFLPETFSSVASEAGLDGSDWSPANQDRVASFYVNKILDENNGDPRQVASVWYTGQPGNDQSNHNEGDYPTPKEYADQVMEKMANQKGVSSFNFNAKDPSGKSFFSMAANVRTSDLKEPFDQQSIQGILGQSGVNTAQSQFERFVQGPHYDQEVLRYGSDVGRRMAPFAKQLQSLFNAAEDAKLNAINSGVKTQQALGLLGLIRNSNNIDNRRAYADIGRNLLGLQFNDGTDQFVSGGQLLDSQIKMNENERNYNEKRREFDEQMAMRREQQELARQELAMKQAAAQQAARAASVRSGSGAQQQGIQGLSNMLTYIKNSNAYAEDHPGEYNPYERTAARMNDMIGEAYNHRDLSNYADAVSVATEALEANLDTLKNGGPAKSQAQMQDAVDKIMAAGGFTSEGIDVGSYFP